MIGVRHLRYTIALDGYTVGWLHGKFGWIHVGRLHDWIDWRASPEIHERNDW